MALIRIAVLLVSSALAVVPGPASAQKYPERPVRLVAPFAPGGGADILGRIVAQRFTELWGVSMFLENKAGASGNLGTDFVARSAPNGETLLITPNGLTVNPSFMKDIPFEVTRDLAPIGMVAASSLVLAIKSSVPAANLRELIALAKRESGKLNYGSTGLGTTPHVAGELVNITADIKTEHIPYRSSGAIIQALLTGEVQMGYVSYNSVESFVRDGQMRLIATLGAARDPGAARSADHGGKWPAGLRGRDLVRDVRARQNSGCAGAAPERRPAAHPRRARHECVSGAARVQPGIFDAASARPSDRERPGAVEAGGGTDRGKAGIRAL